MSILKTIRFEVAAGPTSATKMEQSIQILKAIGRELVIGLPTGEAAVSRDGLWNALRDINGVATFRSEEAILNAHRGLCKLIASASGGLIPVTSAGSGTTAKSRKVRVKDVVHQLGNELETTQHTITVPRSLVCDIDGHLYAPRWLLMRTIHERILNAEVWPERIEGGHCINGDEIWSSLFEPLHAEFLRQAKCNAERQAQREREAELAAKLKAERREAQAAAEVIRKREADEARRKADTRRAARMETLETIRDVYVEWDEWVEFKNARGYKAREKRTYFSENCTLRFAGQRIYIELPEGSEFIKARHNVRWTEEITEDSARTE